MARAQCGYSVTNVCAVTNTCTQWCCQGEGLEMLGGSGEIPQQCLHQGTSPSWGGAACAGVSKAVQIQPCLAAELVRKSSRRKGLSPEIHLAPPPSHPSHQGHPISCQALLTCPLPIS